MKIKLIFDAWSVSHAEKTVEVQSNCSEDDIKSLFLIYFGIEYNEKYCKYEILN